jgi:hypothetical protein
MPRIKEDLKLRTFRSSDDLWERFCDEADAEHKSASYLLRELMRGHIAKADRRAQKEAA